jgi:stage V sporulation protein D (sporulation-specific penicillin-binding protein)
MRKKLRWSHRGKMAFLLALIVAAFVVLVGRLVKIQLVDGNYYASKELKQQLSTTSVAAVRGAIYDRNMVSLAENATVYNVVASPKSITTDKLRSSLADGLSSLLKLDRQTVYNLLSKKTGYQVIAKKVDKATADAVTKYKSENDVGCIWLEQDSKRYYPNGSLASQLLGFTGSDGQGLLGLEAQYNSVLRGVDGQIITARNAKGETMPYGYTQSTAAQDGENLVLTVDEVVQHYLESALSKAVSENNVTNKATGIVMNVKNGEILAMATVPSFDPNDPYTVTDDAEKVKLASLSGTALTQEKNNYLQLQWQNKAVTTPYEPGSVFKVVVAAAALEEGAVTENEQFADNGNIKIEDTTFADWDNSAHGTQSFKQAFEQSWNVVFIQVGLKLGAHNFFNYYSNFGFTSKTGIDLPGEAQGTYYGESQLGSVQLASCSFGQSNKVTAIQLVTALAACSNGGYLVTPHVVREITDSSGNVVKTYSTSVKRQVISSETSKRITALLEDEVNEGSGVKAKVAGYRIGGKTGTAEKLPATEPKKYVASFGGIVPCSDPQYAVLIMLDEPHGEVIYGGQIAAPVAGTLFSEILPYLGVLKK